MATYPESAVVVNVHAPVTDLETIVKSLDGQQFLDHEKPLYYAVTLHINEVTVEATDAGVKVSACGNARVDGSVHLLVKIPCHATANLKLEPEFSACVDDNGHFCLQLVDPHVSVEDLKLQGVSVPLNTKVAEFVSGILKSECAKVSNTLQALVQRELLPSQVVVGAGTDLRVDYAVTAFGVQKFTVENDQLIIRPAAVFDLDVVPTDAPRSLPSDVTVEKAPEITETKLMVPVFDSYGALSERLNGLVHKELEKHLKHHRKVLKAFGAINIGPNPHGGLNITLPVTVAKKTVNLVLHATPFMDETAKLRFKDVSMDVETKSKLVNLFEETVCKLLKKILPLTVTGLATDHIAIDVNKYLKSLNYETDDVKLTAAVRLESTEVHTPENGISALVAATGNLDAEVKLAHAA